MTGVMIQFFHWYLPNDGQLWTQVRQRSRSLADVGFTAAWLPPAYKGHVGGYDVGYGVYDMYDLGEFDQKGSIRTKYGTRQEYLDAIAALQQHGLAVYADIVWNHRLGADGAEVLTATPYSTFDRSRPCGPPREVEVWTRFDFAGRAGAYDSQTMSARDFNAVDFDQRHPEECDTIYVFAGKAFDPHVALDYGNFAYLMGCDVDHASPAVQEAVIKWGKWYLDTTGIDGLRLDAVKHIPSWAIPLYLDAIREHCGRELPTVSEYWTDNLHILEGFLAAVGGRTMLFDVPLHFNLHRASHAGNGYDLTQIFHGTLVGAQPLQAVTFVDNHDSQPLQALQSPVADWFKAHAYALILLREAGFPCVFLADYDGAGYTEHLWDGPIDVHMTKWRSFIDVAVMVRRELGEATQLDYLDHPNCIGWMRRSASGLLVAVVMSNGDAGHKWMDAGQPGRRFVDLVGGLDHVVQTDRHGWAEFSCAPGSVSVWISFPLPDRRRKRPVVRRSSRLVARRLRGQQRSGIQ